jgi:hypothetical protein
VCCTVFCVQASQLQSGNTALPSAASSGGKRDTSPVFACINSVVQEECICVWPFYDTEGRYHILEDFKGAAAEADPYLGPRIKFSDQWILALAGRCLVQVCIMQGWGSREAKLHLAAFRVRLRKYDQLCALNVPQVLTVASQVGIQQQHGCLANQGRKPQRVAGVAQWNQPP